MSCDALKAVFAYGFSNHRILGDQPVSCVQTEQNRKIGRDLRAEMVQLYVLEDNCRVVDATFVSTATGPAVSLIVILPRSVL